MSELSKQAWWENMLKKYSTEEKVREIMGNNGKQSKGTPRKSGFYGSSERAAEAGRKGGRISKRNKIEADNTGQSL